MNLGRPALITMVDDTPANLSVLSDLLSARGFKISATEDGESALEQLQYVQPDLILLDVLMPHLDGFTTCQRLNLRSVRKPRISRSSS
jgi:CheY-like chemotaxis protein